LQVNTSKGFNVHAYLAAVFVGLENQTKMEKYFQVENIGIPPGWLRNPVLFLLGKKSEPSKSSKLHFGFQDFRIEKILSN
jgi:hypothetical protein